MTLPISWPRRSTLVLLAIFLAALVTYGFVRPTPEDAEGAPARQETAVVDEPEPAPTAEPAPSPTPAPDVEPTADESEPDVAAETTGPSPTSDPASAPPSTPALPEGTQTAKPSTAGSDGATATPAA